MGKITFILGGARSGKSSYAAKLAGRKPKKVAFIATSTASDKEMKRRIAIHQKERPVSWKTFEEALNITPLIKNIGNRFNIIIIDCLTLLVSNMMFNGFSQTRIEKEIGLMLETLAGIRAESIIVSNEVGLGIIPKNKVARAFRDIAGRVNQIAAKKSNNLCFMVSGIPWRIK